MHRNRYFEGEFHKLNEFPKLTAETSDGGRGGEASASKSAAAVAAAAAAAERALCIAYAEFHGELVLLEHWVGAVVRWWCKQATTLARVKNHHHHPQLHKAFGL